MRIRTNSFRTWNQELNVFLPCCSYMKRSCLPCKKFFSQFSSSIFFHFLFLFLLPSFPTCSFSPCISLFFLSSSSGELGWWWRENDFFLQWFSAGSDFAFRVCLAMFGDFFGYYNQRGGTWGMVLQVLRVGNIGYETAVLLNIILQCTGQSPTGNLSEYQQC